MRICSWVITASLLLTSSAKAQQSANPSSSPATELTPESAAPSSPPSSRGQPEPQPPNAALPPAAASASITPASVPSTTMDQVVDRAIEREHALMEMLKTRTPFVETYLQDLKFRPQEGPAPAQGHYFLGRMDLSERMNRRDYLAKDTSF